MSQPTIPPQAAFIVTVGVPNGNKDVFCRRAIRVLQQAGFQAGPTSDESIIELATRIAIQNDPRLQKDNA